MGFFLGGGGHGFIWTCHGSACSFIVIEDIVTYMHYKFLNSKYKYT